jgi:aryl-alcohol dehydrogenase (NADP+)
MQHTRLGRTGLEVSRICLGTMTFGLQCDEATSRAILDRAADRGVSFIDTADVYPLGGTLADVGRTEEIVGRWLEGRRDEFVVATKCFFPMGEKPWERGNNRRHIMEAIEASLRRLRTDHVDLYQLHGFDAETPLDETLQALDDIVRAGKVAYVGCSNWLAFRVARAVGRSEARDWVRFESVQPRYNLLFREFERELFPLCAEEQIGVIPYNPMAGGMLSGKHRRGEPTAGTRFTMPNVSGLYQGRYWKDTAFDTVEALQSLADEAGLALPTLAVAWVLDNPVVTAPIIGASRPEQLEATLAAVDVTLDDGLRTRLDELTRAYRSGDADR